MTKRGGLGRGLSALIPGAPEEQAAAGLFEAPIDAVQPNRRQPRTMFDDGSLQALALSIQEVGILQPIVVRRAGTGYELIAGERRLRAAEPQRNRPCRHRVPESTAPHSLAHRPMCRMPAARDRPVMASTRPAPVTALSRSSSR